MPTTQQFKGWDLLDSMPQGWRPDHTAGSPLNGYQFAVNGKSVLHGQQRALVKVTPTPLAGLDLSPPQASATPPTQKKDKPSAIDKEYLETVNKLARARFKQRLLADILIDLQVCEIEGWSKTEYLRELRDLIDGFFEKQRSLF